MLELLDKLNLYTHIVMGAVTLVTGPWAIYYNFKAPGKHRKVGKVFYYAMLIVAISAIFSFFKHPHALFAQFLLGISFMVLVGIFKGVRSIFLMKGDKVKRLDWAYTALGAFNALFMLTMAVSQVVQGGVMALAILFGVFGTLTASDVWSNVKTFSRPEVLHRLDWMSLHLRSMFGAFIASTTAFTVNAAHFLPWWAQWFGPTLLLVPLQVYYIRQVEGMKKKRVEASVEG